MHICGLCKVNANETYNIVTTNVVDKSKLLISLLEEVVTNNELLQRIGNEICSNCCQLLNELHEYQKKVLKISNTLQSYLNHSPDVPPDYVINNVNDNIKEDADLKQTADKKHFKCQMCFKLFVSRNGLLRHLKKLHSEIKCEDVDPLSTVSDVQQNSLVVNDTTNKSTKKSNKRQNSEKPKTYQCPECPKKWKTPGELKNHLYSHSSVKPFICEICGQAYKRKSALDVHVGMHNGVCPFTCVYCKKSFTQKGALRRHLPIHTGETPYQCDLCGKRFIHHTSFKIHSLSHTGEKSYKCDNCGLALLSASHLKRHMRVHTGEKKYVCTTCGKRFAERYNLVSHEKLHNSPTSKKRIES